MINSNHLDGLQATELHILTYSESWHPQKIRRPTQSGLVCPRDLREPRCCQHARITHSGQVSLHPPSFLCFVSNLFLIFILAMILAVLRSHTFVPRYRAVHFDVVPVTFSFFCGSVSISDLDFKLIFKLKLLTLFFSFFFLPAYPKHTVFYATGT